VLGESAHGRAVEAHYAARWGDPIARVRWNRGPIDDLPPDFCVLTFRLATDVTVFATRCTSQPADDARLEIHALCRSGDASRSDLVEILTAVAHYHRTGSSLGLAHSVNFGKPWLAGSACTHGVLSLPYLDGPALEWLDEPRVQFLWLIPVTRAEVEFKKAHGMDALEERFEAARFDYLDPSRASVA
jgi:hypothetical protein